MKNKSKLNRRRKLLRFARFASIILVVLLTNVITYKVTDWHEHKVFAEEQKKIKNANVVKVKSVTDKLGYASFKLDKDKLKNIEDVMIIAHPDDETLWAGDLITKKKFLIICLTNGDNPQRKKEFEQAMQMSDNYGVMLRYPDNPNHKKSDWSKVKDQVRGDMRYLLSYKNWKSIVTHNPDGEYGHIQHKFTSMIVTNICSEKDLTDKLYYFGKYYSIKNLSTYAVQPTLTIDEINAKDYIMSLCYPSQFRAHQKFGHMMGYEKIIKYSDWNFGK